MNAQITIEGGEFTVDLSSPVSLSIELDAHGEQPRHFGAPPASAKPYAVPGFSGSVEDGASCNCDVVTLVPHCNGTHTECVGHLTRERLDAHRITPAGFIPALVVSVKAIAASAAGATGESTDPVPEPRDPLVTRRAIANAWPATTPFTPRALVLRTLPNGTDKRHRDYTNDTPPYLSREAAEMLVNRGIEHLVVDLPSIDRAHDEGRLTAHRILFGLPRETHVLAEAARPLTTITEFAYIPDEIDDGPYLLQLQVPALSGDAVPSRPLVYRITPSERMR